MNEAYNRAYHFFIKEGFLALDKTSYPVLRKYNHYSLLQEMSALMFVVWHYNYFGLYKIINGYLCSIFFYEGREIYSTIHRPVNSSDCSLQHIIDILYDLFKRANLPFLQIKFIEERFLFEYKAISGYEIKTEYFEDNSEYAYKTKDLLDLSGPVNYYKRKRLKIFFNMKEITIRPMTKENIQLCLAIEHEWCTHQDCAYCGSFTGCEKKAMEAMTAIFDDTIHRGLFLYQNEKPVGYIICEKISEKLGLLYFGKSVIQDGFVYLIYMMFKDYVDGVEYMNISEDMGHQGLRRFKRLLSSYELWRKYIITYKL